MQNMGLVGMMTVDWPVGLEGLFSICQFLLLDIDSYGFSCIAGQSEPIRYLLSALIFPTGVAWLALCFAVSKLFPEKHQWEGPKVCSTMGAFLQVGFSTMSATSLAPMMCYQHPKRPAKHHEVSWRHVRICRARYDVSHRMDLAGGVCLWLCGVVRLCRLHGRLAVLRTMWGTSPPGHSFVACVA